MRRIGCKAMLLLGSIMVLGEQRRLSICVPLILWKGLVPVYS